MKDLLNLEILKNTFDDLPVGVGIFKIEDINDIKSVRYVFMNKVVLYEMRKTRDEVFGKKIIEVAPEAYEHEGGLAVIETYRKVAETGEDVNLGLVEYSNEEVAGTYECSVHHIQDNYVYVMLRNVTELEQKKIELERKNKELNQYVSIVSHDLKDPLNSITIVLQLIEREYAGRLDDKLDKFFKYLTDSTTRMRTMITELLDFNSLGQGKEKTSIDCNELIENVQNDLGAKIKNTQTNFQVETLPIINGYKTELRLLFQNLISNGIKFQKEGTTPNITLSVKNENGWTFSVQDNGIGIAEENKDKIFSMFQRLHSTKEYEGSGVGLAHCKKVVELHNGKIWLDSELGKGTTFYFSIPQ
ncbi:MAG: GHKL domain-containing protein [Balneolaceae bacterium]|nr:GHKL domain-containing protein [Balneolaceae bacterium]